jgi:hypothetical protein
VLGFAIGAGLSYLTRGPATKTVALASPTPLAMPFTSAPSARVPVVRPSSTLTHAPRAATARPVAIATPLATELPATDAPATLVPPTARPQTPQPATAAPQTAAPATEAPRAAVTAAPVRTPRPATPAPTPRPATPRPVRTRIPTPEPTAPPTLTPTPPSGPRIAADTGFGKSAADLVRSYIDALISGNDAAAHAALGGGGSLGEKSVVDANTTISSIDAESSGATAIVRVELSTSRGPVFARYSVARTADGPYIREHSFSKP